MEVVSLGIGPASIPRISTTCPCLQHCLRNTWVCFEARGYTRQGLSVDQPDVVVSVVVCLERVYSPRIATT